MKYYEVYLKKDLREKCKCGLCVNHNGFKTTLTTWHAAPIYTGEDIDSAREIKVENPNSIIFEEERAWNYKQLTDQKEIL